MNLKSVIFLFCALVAFVNAKDCPNVKRINSKLICYYSKTKDVDSCYCTHVVLPANTDVKEIENLRRKLSGVKILLTVNEFNQGLVKTVKQNNIDGLELNLKKLNSKEDITEFISTVRTKFGNDLFLALSIPPKTELLAKYYDLKALTKTTDLFILQTAFLGASKNVTFHPSRLSGLWDMQNTDSVVDLVTGLGAPLSRLAVTAPVQAFQFRLQDSEMTTPGSPALEIKTITRKELCEQMNREKEQSWTLERDQDQAGPYIFRGTDWISFEDTTSMDIKAKYTRVRGLAGLALKDLSQDITSPDNGDSTTCSSLLAAAHAGLSKQHRAPRGAVLRSLEREILETPGVGLGHPLEKVNVSPFRITRVVDVEGHVHSVRKDTRTEFTCSRQGYFVHPQSCGRFYRCVKFDQLTDEFSVFEFDCPAGLAFDERVEVCVWPGSLPHGTACQGSSEIAPVPRGRFKCPSQPGYYADPENCRWFFACLDHGQSEMTAYEFRCPFGLVFDEVHLLCQWPWLVPTCTSGHISGLELDSIEYFGGAAKSTLIVGENQGQGHLNVHLTSGAQLLDSYDGLGSLGTVALGGYHGDINILKNSLESQHLGLANVHLHQGGEEGIGLVSGGNDGQYLTAHGGQSGEYVSGYGNEGDALNFHLGQGQGTGATSFSHYEGLNQGINLGSASGTQENIGLLQTDIKSSDIGLGLNSGQNIGSQDKIGVIHFGTGANGANSGLGVSSGHSSNIHHELTGSQINLGLLGEGKQQESVLTLHGGSGLNSNFGDKFSSGYEQSGTLLDSAIIGTGINKGATSSVEFNNYNKGNQGTVLIDSGLKSVSYQGDNDASYKLQVPEQQTVLLDSGIKSNNYVLTHDNSQSQDQLTLLNNAKSTSSNVQYYGSHGNAEQKTVLLNTDDRHLINNGGKSATSFQTIQHSIQGQGKLQEVPVHSTVQLAEGQYGTLNYGYQYGNEGKYVDQPLISQTSYDSNLEYGKLNSPISYGTKLTHNLYGENANVNYATNYYGVTPKTDIFNLKSNTYQYQTPVVQYEQKVQPVVLKTQAEGAKSQSYSQTYHYQSPVVQYEQKVQQPIAYEQKVQVQQPIVYEQKVQPVVLKTQSEGLKSHSYSQTHHYQTPVVQYEQKVQVQQPIVYEQKVQPVVLKTQSEGLKSHSYSQTHHYQTPVVQYEQKVQPVVYEQKVQVQQPIVYEQKVQPVVLKTQSEGLKSQSYSQTHHYQTPVVQYEQKVQPVVYEQKVQEQQPIIYEQKVQPVVLKTQSKGIKSHSYSQTNHYQTPVVQYEQKSQPIVYEQKVEVQQPIVYEQKLQPVVLKTQSEGLKSHSYSQTHHYQSPVVQYEQKEQPIVYEQKVQQPIVYEQKVQQPIIYEQKVQPVQYEQKVQPVIYKTESEGSKSHSHSYSSINHYHTPVVQYQQKVEQQNIPVVQQQEVLLHKEIKTPIVNQQSYSSGYHYQAPVVQYEQKVQPEINLYNTNSGESSSQFYGVQHNIATQEIKTPIVQQEILLPKVQPIAVTPKYEKVEEIKFSSIPSAQIKQTAYSTSYLKHDVPTVQYEQKVQQPLVHYEQKVQPIVYQEKVQPVVHYEQKVQPLVYEQKVQQPIVYEQKVEPVVYKTVSEGTKSHSYSQTYHHQSPVVQYEQQNIELKKVQQPEILLHKVQTVTPKYETQYYEQKYDVTPKYETHYQEINIPVVKQPAAFVSKVNIPVETVSVSPKYESHSYSTIKHHITAPKVEPQYYEQPIQKVQPITYESRVPVVEPKVVQKVVQPLYETYSQPAKVETTYFGKQVDHIQTVTSAPQIVNTYLPVKPIVTKQETREYLPPKPVVNTYYISSTPKPQIYIQPKQVFVSTTPKYSVFQEYVQPKQTFEIKKTVQPITYQAFSTPIVTPVKTVTAAPTIVESYSYLPPKVEFKHESREYLPPVKSTPRTYLPAKLPEVYVSTTPKYSVFQDFVQPQQTFEVKKTVSPTVISEYQYENPEFAHYESNLNFNSAQDLSYQYEPAKLEVKLPKVQTETVYYSTQKPVVSTVKTIPIKNYQTDYIVSTPRPNFVSTIAPIIKQTPTLRTKVVAINKYETLDNQYFVSTPKPVYISTPAPIVTKTESPYGEFKYFDSRFDTAPKQVDILESNQYLKETSDYSDLYNQFGNYEYVDTTPKVKFVTSTVRPIQRKKIVSTTTQIPMDTYQEYYDDKFDSQYIVSSNPTIATTYRPQIRKNYVLTTTESYNDNLGYIITSKPKIASTIRPVQRNKIVSTTTAIPLPIYEENYNNEYVITTSRPKIVTTTLRPIIKKKKIVTTTTASPYDYDEYVVSSVKPESVKITPRPKGKTIVRVNDFHPFLTTKLGAQCTCTSNTLQLRKSKQRVENPEYDFELPDNVPVTKITSSGPTAYDDYNEPGVYVVGNSDVSNDYDYEPKKVVAVTRTPDYVIKSTTNAIQPAPTPIYTIRKKVTTIRPEVSSIYDEPEIILSSTPASAVVDQVFLRKSKSKEQKIAQAVNEGLSLVKSAIKGYVKDAVQEEVRNFDRYGPGGWRSRDETLQGSVDCQRAGLFRHPTQCNKFYACHWDCKKERYTLHVFNCPVHLTFDTTQGACNWPSKGPACTDNTLLPSS